MRAGEPRGDLPQRSGTLATLGLCEIAIPGVAFHGSASPTAPGGSIGSASDFPKYESIDRGTLRRPLICASLAIAMEIACEMRSKEHANHSRDLNHFIR